MHSAQLQIVASRCYPATENASLVWGIQKKQLGTVRGLPKIGCAKRAQRHVGIFKQPDGYVEIRVQGLRGFTNGLSGPPSEFDELLR